ncbi:zinc-binding dehydrogenase [Pseudonocardia sp. TRM90224]|uniref:zinc-binding dehydrogenase n=1 Tax=Pseudonocardia sp. TRM90224 TaxID=2812678 RepID=UPI001E329DF5|nr:zinc-binding dehydrogenase [Pseudonocardia sp. TRM90224]
MHAIRQHTFGPAENLRLEEVDDPQPGAGQVRIAVEAAGIHLVDTFIRAGKSTGPFPPPQLPMTPGREVAGVVDAVGDGVDAAWVGARVVAHLGLASGGYAELAIANVDALHRLADTLEAPAAVAMMGTGRMTMGLLAVAQMVETDVVLVTSAAGGIGTLLVQAARNAGATVVGVAGGPTKVEMVRSNGADVAADYNDPGWVETVTAALDGRGITLAFDGVGGAVGEAVFRLLVPGGRLILFGYSGGEPAAFSSSDLFERGLTVAVALGPRIMGLPGGMRALEERSIAEATAGRLVPAVQIFPLKDAAAAHRALENREAAGKVVLVP